MSVLAIKINFKLAYKSCLLSVTKFKYLQYPVLIVSQELTLCYTIKWFFFLQFILHLRDCREKALGQDYFCCAFNWNNFIFFYQADKHLVPWFAVRKLLNFKYIPWWVNLPTNLSSNETVSHNEFHKSILFLWVSTSVNTICGPINNCNQYTCSITTAKTKELIQDIQELILLHDNRFGN